MEAGGRRLKLILKLLFIPDMSITGDVLSIIVWLFQRAVIPKDWVGTSGESQESRMCVVFYWGKKRSGSVKGIVHPKIKSQL